MPKAYISGPVTGIPGGNISAFREAESVLRAQGWTPIVPHDVVAETIVDAECVGMVAAGKPCPAYTWCRCMAELIPWVGKAAVIVMLDGWEKSPGARRELAEAAVQGIPARLFSGSW